MVAASPTVEQIPSQTPEIGGLPSASVATVSDPSVAGGIPTTAASAAGQEASQPSVTVSGPAFNEYHVVQDTTDEVGASTTIQSSGPSAAVDGATSALATTSTGTVVGGTSTSGVATSASVAGPKSSGTGNSTADASQYKAPHYVMYTDSELAEVIRLIADVHYELPSASDLLPINRYLMAFWLTNSPKAGGSFGPYDVSDDSSGYGLETDDGGPNSG